MHIAQIFHENFSPMTSLSTVVEEPRIETCAFEIDIVQDTRCLYQQSMEEIREKIRGICEGQDRVVMSQLWALGKKARGSAIQNVIHRAPSAFPALVAHGFIVERLIDSYVFWEPCSPYLKDFWLIGIHVSNGHGFLLQPEHVFRANIQAALQMSM